VNEGSYVAISTQHTAARDLRGLSLCSGVGGLDLGLHIAEPGYRTVCFIERQAHAAAALVARMEDTSLAEAPIWDDLRSFDGQPWRGRIHLISAGYPCQPFSYSGKRQGEADPRHLWPEVARIIEEASPRWVFLENVPGHINMGFKEVLSDLRKMGYGAAACVISAAEVGASHIRERLFILGDANIPVSREPCGLVAEPSWRKDKGGTGERLADGAEASGAVMDTPVAATLSSGMEGNRPSIFAPGPGSLTSWHPALRSRPDLQPALFGMDDGMADRVERCAEAGNGVVPLAAAYAWRSLRAALSD